MFVRRLIAATILVGLSAVGASAAAYETWQPEELELRLDVTAYTSFASKQYQHTGDLFDLVDERSSGSYQQLGTVVDAEFGLFQDVGLYVTTTLQTSRLRSEFGSASVTGLSDFHLGGKWRAIDGAVTLTLAPEVKFPTGYTPDAGTYRPVLGNGVNEYTARVWFGKRFDDAPFYFEVGSGYRLRGARLPRGGGPKIIYTDEIPYDLEVGFWITPFIAAHLLVDGVVGLGPADTIRAVEFSPIAQSYTHVGGGLTYRVSKGLRLLGQYRTTVAGINALNLQFIGLGATVDYGI